MKERERELRRRRHRREKARKERIKALIGQARAEAKPAKKLTEAAHKEAKTIQKKPPVKIVRPSKSAKKKTEPEKGSEKD